jgi:hypothetical protein
MRRRLPLCLCPSHLQNVLRQSPPLIPPPFSRRGLRLPPCLLSLRHNTTPLAATLTPITVLSPRLYRVPKRSPARRAANQAVHTVVSLLPSSTARAPSHPPTLHRAHASRLPWLRRVRRRRHTTHSLHRHQRPHLLHLLPRLRPLRAPARLSHDPPRHFSFPSHSVAQSQTATSHTSKRTDSSTI